MVWQDSLIAAVNIVFSIALLPQVFHGFKRKRGFIALSTSGLTFAGAYTVSFAFYTLSLYFSAVTSFIIATLWLVLFIQRIIYKAA